MSDTITVELERDLESPILGTLGTLRLGGNRLCDTLELPYRNNAEFVSRIPAGLFGLVWQWSKRFRAFRWHVTDVPNRSAIEIHSGNTLKDTVGCILVGLSRIVTPDSYFVLQSLDALSVFDDAMKPYRTIGASLSITNPSQRIVV